jgi:3-oxoacyl-[acyl-carrier-protein] synthase-1
MGSTYSEDPIVVTGLGMVGSLGTDSVTCAAAFRAGLSGAKEFGGFLVLNQQENTYQSIYAHQVPFLTEGFEGLGRLVRLGWSALQELLAQDDIRKEHNKRTGVILALRDYRRPKENLPDVDMPPVQQEATIRHTGGLERKEFVQGLGKQLFQKLSNFVALRFPEPSLEIIDAGHAGVCSAIHAAIQGLRAGVHDRYLVGGIDSFLNRESLGWLAENYLIKTEELASGMQPGEAGTFIILEEHRTALARKAPIRGIISATSVGCEQENLFVGRPCRGQGLVKVLSEVFVKMSKEVSGAGWIITDQNGEVYRASEWGNALVRLLPNYPELQNAKIWFPAASFGDTGSASGGVGLALVLRAFQRNFHVAKRAIILSSSPWGERSALSIESP